MPTRPKSSPVVMTGKSKFGKTLCNSFLIQQRKKYNCKSPLRPRSQNLPFSAIRFHRLLLIWQDNQDVGNGRKVQAVIFRSYQLGQRMLNFIRWKTDSLMFRRPKRETLGHKQSSRNSKLHRTQKRSPELQIHSRRNMHRCISHWRHNQAVGHKTGQVDSTLQRSRSSSKQTGVPSLRIPHVISF